MHQPLGFRFLVLILDDHICVVQEAVVEVDEEVLVVGLAL